MKKIMLVCVLLHLAQLGVAQFNYRLGSTVFGESGGRDKNAFLLLGLGYRHNLSKSFFLDVSVFKTGGKFKDFQDRNVKETNLNLAIGLGWQIKKLSIVAGIQPSVEFKRRITSGFDPYDGNSYYFFTNAFVGVEYDLSKRLKISARYIPVASSEHVQLSLVYKTKWFIRKEN
jgi:hypothetical protein